MELLFERFLSEERGEAGHRSDLPSGDRRERAIQYVLPALRQVGCGNDGKTLSLIVVAPRHAKVGKALGFDVRRWDDSPDCATLGMEERSKVQPSDSLRCRIGLA